MDEDFGFDEPVRRPGPQIKLSIWDMLAVLTLLVTFGVVALVLFLFFNPAAGVNPLPPSIPTAFVMPSATITPIQLEATWTPTFVDGTETPTLAPTITLQPTNTPLSLVPPSKTPKPTATPKAPFSATVSAIESTILYPDSDCTWTGVAGTVVDATGAQMFGLRLRLTGTFGGKAYDQITVSGAEPLLGPSGFSFKLGDTPAASSSPLTLQLLDQGGLPLADNVYVTTYSACNKNLILVRYKANK